MKVLRPGMVKGVLVAVSTVSVMAAAAIGGARGMFFPSDDVAAVQEGEPQECVAEGIQDGPEASGCEEEDGAGEESPDPGEGAEEGGSDPDDVGGDAGQETAVTSAQRAAACEEASGLADHPLPEGEKLTGVDNALSRVLENCKKNPEAPGLIVALERLAENRLKHEARGQGGGVEEPRGRGLGLGLGRDHPGQGQNAGPPGERGRGPGS